MNVMCLSDTVRCCQSTLFIPLKSFAFRFYFPRVNLSPLRLSGMYYAFEIVPKYFLQKKDFRGFVSVGESECATMLSWV